MANSTDSVDSADSTDSADLMDSYFNPNVDRIVYFKVWIIIIVIIGSLLSFNREVTVKIST